MQLPSFPPRAAAARRPAAPSSAQRVHQLGLRNFRPVKTADYTMRLRVYPRQGDHDFATQLSSYMSTFASSLKELLSFGNCPGIRGVTSSRLDSEAVRILLSAAQSPYGLEISLLCDQPCSAASHPLEAHCTNGRLQLPPVPGLPAPFEAALFFGESTQPSIIEAVLHPFPAGLLIEDFLDECSETALPGWAISSCQPVLTPCGLVRGDAMRVIAHNQHATTIPTHLQLPGGHLMHVRLRMPGMVLPIGTLATPDCDPAPVRRHTRPPSAPMQPAPPRPQPVPQPPSSASPSPLPLTSSPLPPMQPSTGLPQPAPPSPQQAPVPPSSDSPSPLCLSSSPLPSQQPASALPPPSPQRTALKFVGVTTSTKPPASLPRKWTRLPLMPPPTHSMGVPLAGKRAVRVGGPPAPFGGASDDDGYSSECSARSFA